MPDVLARALDDGVRHVCYCAGGLMPLQANRDPCSDITGAMFPLITVLEALRQRPGVRLQFLSSGGTVYGHPQSLPIAEDHPTNPVSVYGINKLAADKYVAMYSSSYGIPAVILRCSNVYGERQSVGRGQGVVATLLQRLMLGLPLPVFGDGKNVRDYLYVGDLVRAMLSMLWETEPFLLLNVGTGLGTSQLDLLATMEQVTSRSAPIEWQPGRPFDVQVNVLDTAPLRERIPWSPLRLQDGLRRTWDSMLEASALRAQC